jgi:hypothetical protein
MSGVLDRMVQRSRGHLPAIEPLVRSQQTAAAAVPLIVEESAAAASRGRNAAVSRGESALRQESAAPLQEKVRRDAARVSLPAPADSRRFEALDVAPVKHAAESDGTPAAKDVDQDGWKRARLEQVVESPDAQGSEEPHKSSIEMLPEEVLAKSEDTRVESIRPKAKLEQRATPDLSATRNAADTTALAMDEAEHTEIHITIGSVELRAPRVTPSAPKAPFRPQVTLDEFLKRGTGSGGRGTKP